MTLLPQSFITSSVTFDFYFPWHFWVRQNLFWPSFSQCSWQLRAGAPGVSASCLFNYWRGLDSRRLRLLQCLVPFEWLWLFSSIMDFFKLLLWSSCCNLICSHSHDHALTTYLLWIPHSSIFFFCMLPGIIRTTSPSLAYNKWRINPLPFLCLLMSEPRDHFWSWVWVFGSAVWS